MAQTKKKKGPTTQKTPQEPQNENKPRSDKPQKPKTDTDDKSKRNNGIWDKIDKVLSK